MSDVNEIINSLDDEAKEYMSKLTQEEFNEIIEKAKMDSNKMTQEDIDELLDIIETPDDHYLENCTTDSILTEIFNVIQENDIPNCEKIIEKLKNYRYVDEINQIFKGKNIKYINKNTKKFNNGGLVLDVKFLNNGTHILCKGYHHINQIKFDDVIIFQMLSTEEQLLLLTNSVALNV